MIVSTVTIFASRMQYASSISTYIETTKTASIQISTHCKFEFQLNALYKMSLLQSIISFQKKRKRFKNTKNRSRIELLLRVDFNILLYVSRRFDFVVILSRNVKRASKRIAERVKRTIRQKQKIEQSN